MLMLEFICLFCPSFVSLLIDARLTKTEKIPNLLLKYPVYVIINNLVALALLIIKNRHELPLTTDLFTIDFLAICLVVNTIIAIFTPFIKNYLFADFIIGYAPILPKKYKKKKREKQKWFKFGIKIVNDHTPAKNAKNAKPEQKPESTKPEQKTELAKSEQKPDKEPKK